MFIRNATIDEIAASLEANISNLENAEEARLDERRANILNYLMAAANLFDEVGLEKEANMVTQILSKFAEHDPATKGLTSQKMLSNLEHKGWVFNAADGATDDTHDAHDKKEIEVTDEPEIDDDDYLKNL